jgi:hypothetical protein
MATDTLEHYALLDDLDARQDEVLAQLDELNSRLEGLLASHTEKDLSSADAACSDGSHST